MDSGYEGINEIIIYHHAVAGGSRDCQLSISDCFNPERPIDNRQLAIGTGKTHPLPGGGIDLMGPQHQPVFLSPAAMPLIVAASA